MTNTSEAARLMSLAFAADPLFSALFPSSDKEKTAKQRQAFFSFLLEKSEALGELKLERFTENGGEEELAALALVEQPAASGSEQNGLRFLQAVLKLICHVPFSSFLMLNSYMKETLSARPKEAHYYLICIATSASQQRQGHGKALLKAIHERVDQDPAAIGIGLDTENLENVAYYETFGYQLTAVKALGTLKIYCMFRPKKSVK